ncbi:MAG TPA: DNA polymerase III subunit chi [Stellaceae bacterium]|nr:DNA polymerase III subunit chi [Stellaceae bacterium]
MAEVGLYHLGATALERALPRLLERALADGQRVVVLAGSQERVAHLDSLLWTYNEASFLPHGSARDGNAARHPICLTDRDENPNGATMLVLLDGTRSERMGAFARCCDLFDGNDQAAVEAARQRWSAAKSTGHSLTYWEQTVAGWEKRGA